MGLTGQPWDYQETRFVIDQQLITSRGPGTAIEFSLALIEVLYNKEKSEEIKKQIIG